MAASGGSPIADTPQVVESQWLMKAPLVLVALGLLWILRYCRAPWAPGTGQVTGPWAGWSQGTTARRLHCRRLSGGNMLLFPSTRSRR
jgi:hypothetical protein